MEPLLVNHVIGRLLLMLLVSAVAVQAGEPAADKPVITKHPADIAAFDYQAAQVPFYDPEATKWGQMREPLITLEMP